MTRAVRKYTPRRVRSETFDGDALSDPRYLAWRSKVEATYRRLRPNASQADVEAHVRHMIAARTRWPHRNGDWSHGVAEALDLDPTITKVTR